VATNDSDADPQLFTATQVATRLGVSIGTVQGWIRRDENPLPSVQVGDSGRVRKVLVAEIDSWLKAEAERNPARRA